MDFAKNKTIKYQNEIKSAFFTAQQVTMHPIVTYYRNNSGMVRDSSIVISKDNTHDHHAVRHFQNIVMEHLQEQIGYIPKRNIIFSDGCSSQYKSKGPFADLIHEKIEVNRNYFGSEHGKGDCDADIGVVNRLVDRAIVGGKVIINNSKDLFNFCSANFTLDDTLSKRHFLYVDTNEINRNRHETINAKTVPCTRKIHQLRNLTDKPSFLKVRNHSCFCASCELGNDLKCLNAKYVNQYREIKIEQGKTVNAEMKTKTSETTLESNISYTGSLKPRMLKPIKSLTLKSSNPKLATRSKTTLASISMTTPASRSKTKPVSTSKTTPASRSKTTPSSTSKTTPASRSKTTPSSTSKTTPASRFKTTPASTSKTTPASRSKTTPSSISTTRHSPSQLLWKKLSSCQIYDDLQQIIAQTELEALPQLPEVTFLTHKRTIDQTALGLIPEDQLAVGLYPCNVYGDGNCLPRCASLLVYGHENNHLEMRARIIDELVRHEDSYLDDNFLTNGCNSSAHGNVAVQFAMFSEKYDTQKLSGVAVQRIFRAEVLDLCRSGRYMGAWQMAALANVLKTEVVSVYPLYGGKTMRNDLHRRFPPFRVSELDNAKAVYILWSNINGANIPESDWRPNHFVPLLKTGPDENRPSPDKSYIDEVEALSPLFDFEDDDDEQDSFIFNTSMVNNIIQELGNDQMPNVDKQATIADRITNNYQLPRVDDQATIAVRITTDNQMPDVDAQSTIDDQITTADQMLDVQATITDWIQNDDQMPDIQATIDDQMPDIQSTIADRITTDDQMPEVDAQATISDRITTNYQLPQEDDRITTDDQMPEVDAQATTSDRIATDDQILEVDEHAVIADKITSNDQMPKVNTPATIDDQMPDIWATIADRITTDDQMPKVDAQATISDQITTNYQLPEVDDQATIADWITTDVQMPEVDAQATIADRIATNDQMPKVNPQATIDNHIAIDDQMPEEDDQAAIADRITTNDQMPEIEYQAIIADRITTDDQMPEADDQATIADQMSDVEDQATIDDQLLELNAQPTIADQITTDDQMLRSPLLTSSPGAIKLHLIRLWLSYILCRPRESARKKSIQCLQEMARPTKLTVLTF